MLIITIKKKRKGRYFLQFQYDSELINVIKNIDKRYRKFDPEKKAWDLNYAGLSELIPLLNRDKYRIKFFSEEEYIEFKREFELYKKIKQEEQDAFDNSIEKQKNWKELKVSLFNETLDIESIKPFFKGVPYQYQYVGSRLLCYMGSGMLAMEQGTGKTITSLLACEYQPDTIKKVIIVCPKSLVFNWKEEIEKWTYSKYYIWGYNKNKYSYEEAKYILFSYGYFNPFDFSVKEKILKHKLDCVDMIICDESHKLKNVKSNTYKNFLKSFKNSSNGIYLLTGTPMPNRIDELYSQLKLLLKDEVKTKEYFMKEICGLTYSLMTGWSIPEDENLEQLNSKLEGIMYRVKKRDVLKDLPDIQINKIYIDISTKDRKEYNQIIDETESDIALYSKLRKFLSNIKVKYVDELIGDLSYHKEKLVIFDDYLESLKFLTKKYDGKSALYSGELTKAEKRQELVNIFQDLNSYLKYLFISTEAGNYGITLTAADTLLQISQSYIPASNEQAYARLDRIGQKNNVQVYIFLCRDTVDIDIDELVESKKYNINKVVDNVEYSDASHKNDLKFLINKIRYKNN